MTKIRKPPKLDYHTLIVRPTSDFDPKDWRDRPTSYSVISYEGQQQLRGRADAWRFTHNREVLEKGISDTWAIVCTRFESLSSPGNN